MREQIHHETVTPAEWLFCSDGLLPCFRDNETGIRNGPAFFQQARRAPLHGSPLQPACQTAGSPTGPPPRRPQRRSPAHGNPRRPAAQPPLHNNLGTARSCALLHNPPGHRPSPSYRIPPPELPRPAIHSGAAPLHNNPRRPAAQPPLHGHPAIGHEMADKPARQPPAGPPSPAPSCITRRAASARRPPPPGNANQPPGARRCACPTATSVPWRGHPARAALSLRETRTTPPARAAAHARPLHPFRGGATRRAPLRRGREEGGGPPKIYFFSSPNTP